MMPVRKPMATRPSCWRKMAPKRRPSLPGGHPRQLNGRQHQPGSLRRGLRPRPPASTLIKQLWGPASLLGDEPDEFAASRSDRARRRWSRVGPRPQDHFTAADKLCRDALAIVENAFGPKHLWAAEIHYTLERLNIAANPLQRQTPFRGGARRLENRLGSRRVSAPSASWETSPRWTAIRR